MPDSYADFETALNKAIETKITKRVDRIFKDMVLTGWGYITANASIGAGFGSPVLTGRFYASHNISINSIDNSVAPPNPAGAAQPYAQQNYSKAISVLRQWQPGDSVIISNSLDYAYAIEEEQASRKTPEGVYAVAVAAIKAKFADTSGISTYNVRYRIT